MRTRSLASAILLLTSSLAAKADTFTFTYKFLYTGLTLTATVNGTLLADKNTFQVTGDKYVSYGGQTQAVNPTALESYAQFYNNNYSDRLDNSGRLTLDGSLEDLIDYNRSKDLGYVISENSSSNAFNHTIAYYGYFAGPVQETFDKSRYSASVVTSVAPEPSSFVLLGTGLLGAVGVVRKRLLR